ncbi:MAG TPA: hypothetical protein VFJ24_08880 [Gaiellales bacterium]|nr:hypothetical protein [Gaiellales bacterium]
MKRLLQAFGLIVATLLAPGVSRAQTDTATGDGPFRFQLEESVGPRGKAVEGYVYSGLPWRITNVQLRVESVDASGTVIASASGWVMGDVAARGRGYFYVPITTPAPTYRASVQTFDKVTLESPQAP